MILRTKRFFLWSHYLLFVAGLSTLAYCMIVTLEASHYQDWAREQLQKRSSDSRLSQRHQIQPSSRHTHVCTAAAALHLWAEWIFPVFTFLQ